MKATLRIPAPETESGYKEIEIDIAEEELEKLAAPQKPSKQTGYERAEKSETYYYIEGDGEVDFLHEDYDSVDLNYNTIANYYSSKLVAENNARADKLMRQLRRFAVEHRTTGIIWDDSNQEKWFFEYDHRNKNLSLENYCSLRDFGVIYFDSYKAADAALEEFHDELIWYFTEYKDSL